VGLGCQRNEGEKRHGRGAARNWAVLLGFGLCGEERGRPSGRLGRWGEQAVRAEI